MTADAAPRPGGSPHLREALGAAAAACGLRLRGGAEGALTDTEAREAALRWGIAPPAEEDRAPATVVVLVDGLGLHQLEERRGHAPSLRSWLAESSAPGAPGPAARTCSPSTTAAALTTLGTGALPGATGMVGYSVRNPLLDEETGVSAEANLCLITWEGRAPDPRSWQDVPTVFERLERDPARSHETRGQTAPLAVTIGPARFAGSGLTEAGLRGAVHVAADRLEDRPGLAAAAVRRGTPLVYLYVGELDHTGHGRGWRSQDWLVQLERLDAAMAELRRRLPRGTRIILTADHGMIDTSEDRRLDIEELCRREPRLGRGLAGIAGEPRFTHLYLEGGTGDEAAGLAAEAAALWREVLGERVLRVVTREESAELLGGLSARAASVVGDVVVAMAEDWVLVDHRVHSPQAIAMPGVHGSLTDAETTIPLLLVEA